MPVSARVILSGRWGRPGRCGRGRVGWYLLLEVVHAVYFCKYSWMEVGSGHCTPYPQGLQWLYLPHCAHLWICSFFILFEGFVKKAWRWHRLNSMKRLGEHILPEMCVQFSSTKLSSTRWLILHRIPQVWNCNVLIFLCSIIGNLSINVRVLLLSLQFNWWIFVFLFSFIEINQAVIFYHFMENLDC